MELKTLTYNIKIPILGLGTWEMGGRLTKNTSHDKECIKAIKEAIKLGMTHIDTAELYGNGHAEELIAEAIKNIERKKLFITSKVKPNNLNYDDLISSCKASLKRLKTDHLDLYLIHFPNDEIPLKETMKAMDYLVENKLTRFIGVSNFNVEELKEAMKNTKNKIICNQIEHSLVARDKGKYMEDMESEIIPFCKKNNINIFAWRPLAKGILCKTKYPALNLMAQKYKKTQAQVALNWVISKGHFALVKTTNIEHIKENIGATGWRLNDNDIEYLDNEFSCFKNKYYE